MTKDFRWLMDKLGGACVGNGVDIPKFHEIMSSVGMIRKFGSLHNASCDWGERGMKPVKAGDERVGRSRNNDGGARVSKFVTARETDDAIGSHESILTKKRFRDLRSTSYSSSAHATTGRAKAFGASSYNVGAGENWRIACNDLLEGKCGVKVPHKMFPEVEQCAAHWANGGIIKCRRQISFSECNLYSGLRSHRILFPGHCVEFVERNIFAQVLLVYLTSDKEPGGQHLLVWIFDIIEDRHPELPLQHLRRGQSVSVVPVNKVLRRCNIVPIFKAGINNSPSVLFAKNFLVDTSVYELVAGPEDREVYLSCPRCSHPALRPLSEGKIVLCQKCQNKFRWL